MKPRLLLLLLCVLIHQPAVASPTTSTEVASTATSAPSLWTPHCASILLDKAQKALGVNVDVQFLVLPADISDGKLEMVNPTDVPHSALANVSVQSSGNLSQALECENGSDLRGKCDKITLAAREMNITLYRKRCDSADVESGGENPCFKPKISCQNSTAKGTAKTCNGAPGKLAFVYFDAAVPGEQECMQPSWRLTLLAAAAPTTSTRTSTTAKPTTNDFTEGKKMEPTDAPPGPIPPKPTAEPPPKTDPPQPKKTEPQLTVPTASATTTEEASTDAAERWLFEWTVVAWLLGLALR